MMLLMRSVLSLAIITFFVEVAILYIILDQKYIAPRKDFQHRKILLCAINISEEYVIPHGTSSSQERKT
jgi:hypothetical protein